MLIENVFHVEHHSHTTQHPKHAKLTVVSLISLEDAKNVMLAMILDIITVNFPIVSFPIEATVLNVILITFFDLMELVLTKMSFVGNMMKKDSVLNAQLITT